MQTRSSTHGRTRPSSHTRKYPHAQARAHTRAPKQPVSCLLAHTLRQPTASTNVRPLVAGSPPPAATPPTLQAAPPRQSAPPPAGAPAMLRTSRPTGRARASSAPPESAAGSWRSTPVTPTWLATCVLVSPRCAVRLLSPPACLPDKRGDVQVSLPARAMPGTASPPVMASDRRTPRGGSSGGALLAHKKMGHAAVAVRMVRRRRGPVPAPPLCRRSKDCWRGASSTQHCSGSLPTTPRHCPDLSKIPCCCQH